MRQPRGLRFSAYAPGKLRWASFAGESLELATLKQSHPACGVM